MNFLLTSFFKEIDKPITLVALRKMVLDNPRTKLEIDHIITLLTRATSMHGVHASMLPGIAVASSWPNGLDAVRNRALAAVTDDQIPPEDAHALMKEMASAVAPQLVLCRFDDEGAFGALQKARENLVPGSFILLGDENPLILRSREAFEIGHLLAILACDTDEEGELGDTFILDNNIEWSAALGESLTHSLVSQCIIRARPGDLGSRGFDFADLDHYGTRLEEAGQHLDSRLSMEDDGAPLLYAGQLLAIAAGTRGSRTKLVNLVALLELLLTRNPDSSRFNVEDSLTKQFVLKLGVLLHRQSPSLDLDWSRRALRDLYRLRSSIAHGDFGNLDKLLAKSCFAESDDGKDGFLAAELRMERACVFAYECTRCALWACVADPPLVAFLKSN